MCSHSLLTHLTKKLKLTETLEAPQNRSFYSKIECLPFGPPIYTLSKACALKEGAIGNTSKTWGAF
jgi:hypothetical protein